MNPSTLNMILKLLDLLVLGMNLAPKLKASFDENRSKIQQMIDEGREPTQSEWETLLEEVQKNTDELNG